MSLQIIDISSINIYIHEPKEHLCYIKDKLFKNQAFSRIIPHNRLVLPEKSTEKLPNDHKATKIHTILAWLIQIFKLLQLMNLCYYKMYVWVFKQYIPKEKSHFGIKEFFLYNLALLTYEISYFMLVFIIW